MIPRKKTIEDLIDKHSLLKKDLSSGKIDKKLFAEKSKEYSDLNEIINDTRKIKITKKINEDFKEASLFAGDLFKMYENKS